jgi:hypothetical protein
VTNDSAAFGGVAHPLASFVPFAPLVMQGFHKLMPLRWIALFSVLQAMALLSLGLNFVANDFVWCSMAIWTYIVIAMPLYRTSVGSEATNDKVATSESHEKLTFDKLFRTCLEAVFSDYKLSLASKIPLALQVLAGGSLLYEVFGADWLMHTLAGFGVGAIALRAYETAVNRYGYPRLASYFGLNRFRTFRVERKHASAEFTLFSIVVIAFVWEAFERAVHFVSPVNVFRIGLEPLWNVFGDLVVALCGAMTAWYLFTHKTRWR